MKRFNKLVRNNVPNVIRDEGRRVKVKIATDGEYYERLKLKLVEEAEEFRSHEEPEDLADLLEVIHCLADVIGTDLSKIEKLRLKKKEKLGSFDEKVLLIEADHPKGKKKKF